MNIIPHQIGPISEVTQNFSRVARIADQKGSVYIFKNNKPQYKLTDIENDTTIEMTDEEKIRVYESQEPVIRRKIQKS